MIVLSINSDRDASPPLPPFATQSSLRRLRTLVCARMVGRVGGGGSCVLRRQGAKPKRSATTNTNSPSPTPPLRFATRGEGSGETALNHSESLCSGTAAAGRRDRPHSQAGQIL